MSVKKFKFVSPGIFLKEIDKSQIPRAAAGVGPLVIGRSRRGPGNRPVRVSSYSEFVQIFGEPHPGTPEMDVWRSADGPPAPTYAAYAARAWLANNTPLTFVRLVGRAHSSKTANSGEAGWWTYDGATKSSAKLVDGTVANNGGAYGLWLLPSSSNDAIPPLPATVAAEYNDFITVTSLSTNDQTFIFNVPAEAGGTGTDTTIHLDASEDVHTALSGTVSSGSANTIVIAASGLSNAQIATAIYNAIDGDGLVVTGERVGFAGSGDGQAGSGIAGLSASVGSSTTKAHVYANAKGIIGNQIHFSASLGSALGIASGDTTLSGGVGPDGNKDTTPATGTLAAVFYIANGGVMLSGTTREGATTGSNSTFIKSVGPNAQFIAEVRDQNGALTEKVTFDFAEGSSNHIRKVFNTNPTLINQDITTVSNQKSYWLGETFESAVRTYITDDGANAAGDVFGVILGMENSAGDADGQWSNRRYDAQAAQSPWIFSQHLGDNASFSPSKCTNLFRFAALQASAWEMHNLKISIEEIAPGLDDLNPWTTFSVVLRRITDDDTKREVIEQYRAVNLNPASSDYIGARIGTQYTEFDTTQRRLRTYGKYANKSRYIRVIMNEALDENGMEPALAPFGFQAPPRPYDFSVVSTASAPKVFGAGQLSSANETKQFAQGKDIVFGSGSASDTMFISASVNLTGAFKWPTISCRASSADAGVGSSNPTNAWFGFYTGKSTSDTNFDASILDLLRPLPASLNSETFDAGSNTKHPFYFTLDDLSGSVTSANPNPNDNNAVVWVSGSRVGGNSITAQSTGSASGGGAGESNLHPSGWRFLLSKLGINKFIVPMHGGFDGYDVTEREPFRNQLMAAVGTDEKTSYSYNTINEALDIVSATEDYEYNIMAAPGITNNALTEKMITTCEERGDSLAIIDLPGVYVPSTEKTYTNQTSRYGSVRETVANLKDRKLNSSYGCTYYPWLQIQDTTQGSNLFVPPSVVALGTMAASESSSQLWFAPAGFNRGGLSAGGSGLAVIGVTEKLSSKDRDSLYEANINPIASFPAEGIVVFGQKTLQVTASALDRINVRRLLIYIKKEISRMASQVLFDQNVPSTWNRFVGMADPFLSSIQTGLGLSDYRIVLDESTTTDDLIDRNIMYAKIFLKPARSIEYIAIDFMITSAGASFED